MQHLFPLLWKLPIRGSVLTVLCLGWSQHWPCDKICQLLRCHCWTVTEHRDLDQGHVLA